MATAKKTTKPTKTNSEAKKTVTKKTSVSKSERKTTTNIKNIVSEPVKKVVSKTPEVKKPAFQNDKKDIQKTKKGFSSAGLLWLLFALIFIGVVGYVNYKNSVQAVNDYYATNDERRAEDTYKEFIEEQPKSRIVMTEFDLSKPVFSLVQESTREGEQIFVETFYLKRTSPIKFKVTKSFRNIVSNKSFDEAVKLAIKQDLHLDNPDENQTDIISVRDLDLTPEQRVQAEQQKQAQEEQQKAQEEYEALPTEQKIERLNSQITDIKGFISAIENGETTYNGQEIPTGVDVNYLGQVLQGTQAEIDRLSTEVKE